VAGATSEWTEGVITLNTGERFRIYDGSSWLFDATYSDLIPGYGGEFPNLPAIEFGLRIAAVVPGPASTGLAAAFLLLGGRRKRGGFSWFEAFDALHQQP